MTHLVLNIGLQVGAIVPTGQLVHTLKFVAELFEPSKLRTELAQSSTELTLIIELDTTIGDIANRVYTLCLALHQDAIAYTHNGAGLLVGPKAEDWGGAFDSSLFLNPSWS